MTILVILSIVSFYILVTYTIDVGNTIFQITRLAIYKTKIYFSRSWFLYTTEPMQLSHTDCSHWYIIQNTSYSQLSVPVNLLVVGVAHLVGVLLAAVSCYFWGRRATVSSLHIIILGLLVIICGMVLNIFYTFIYSN